MNRLDTIFGSVPLQKVGTFNAKEEGKIVDLYAARLVRGKSTDSTIVLMFADHNDKNPGVAHMTDVAWNTFMVRSYPHVNAMLAAVKQVDSNVISSMRGIRVKTPKWGDFSDIVLNGVKRTQDYTMYEHEALNAQGYRITGFVESGSQLGNDLETQVELIPLLMSYNFCVQKK